MRIHTLLLLAAAAAGLSGCIAMGCCARHQNSSSLVDFLYPDGKAPPLQDAIVRLPIPLRVGLAFLPDSGRPDALDAAHKEMLLEQVRDRFRTRPFVADIVLIPDYYLASAHGFAGLQGAQRLYGVDLMALVSYDQVIHLDDNNWSIGYLTIIGTYFLKGSRHDTSTLVDLAVIDPTSHSLVLRAGGTDVRHGNTTLMSAQRRIREAGNEGFDGATQQMIEHFDTALTRFETDVKAGKASVRIINRDGTRSGGGALDGLTLLAVLLAGIARLVCVRSQPNRGFGACN